MATMTEKDGKVIDLAEFAGQVIDVAQNMKNSGRFSEHKAWIHAVWALGNFEPSLIEFKRLLIAAHRERLLTLCRLDLVEAADPYDVRRSRATYLDAEFNLILIK